MSTALHISAVAQLTGAPEHDLRVAIKEGRLSAIREDGRTYIPLGDAAAVRDLLLTLAARLNRQTGSDVEPRDSSDLSTAEAARILRCSPEFIRKNAKRHGIGYFIGGRNGFMFTDADIEKFRAILAPKPPEARRRRPRRRSPA